MEPSKEFDELFEEMKDVERSDEARRHTWLALKKRMQTKRRRKSLSSDYFISSNCNCLISNHYLFTSYGDRAIG